MIQTIAATWLLDGATRDAPTLTAAWTPAALTLIDGVAVREVRHVPKQQGYLTEIFRREWEHDTPSRSALRGASQEAVDQVFQVVLNRGAISAWHAHDETTDRLFITHGLVRLVLYDARSGSPTRGLVNEFRFGTVRPALVTVPPRVWHGIQNIADEPSVVVNLVDRAYDYASPDHWRVPQDSPSIPFSW